MPDVGAGKAAGLGCGVIAINGRFPLSGKSICDRTSMCFRSPIDTPTSPRNPWVLAIILDFMGMAFAEAMLYPSHGATSFSDNNPKQLSHWPSFRINGFASIFCGSIAIALRSDEELRRPR